MQEERDIAILRYVRIGTRRYTVIDLLDAEAVAAHRPRLVAHARALCVAGVPHATARQAGYILGLLDNDGGQRPTKRNADAYRDGFRAGRRAMGAARQPAQTVPERPPSARERALRLLECFILPAE